MVPAADLASLPALRSATSQKTGCCERRAYTRIGHKSKGRTAFSAGGPRLVVGAKRSGSDLHQSSGVTDIGDEHGPGRQTPHPEMAQ